jgi:hypothetical protein
MTQRNMSLKNFNDTIENRTHDFRLVVSSTISETGKGALMASRRGISLELG